MTTNIPRPDTSGDSDSNKPIALEGRWRETLALLAILGLALGLRLWDLERGGWGAEYYSAAVRSMALSWRNFFIMPLIRPVSSPWTSLRAPYGRK